MGTQEAVEVVTQTFPEVDSLSNVEVLVVRAEYHIYDIIRRTWSRAVMKMVAKWCLVLLTQEFEDVHEHNLVKPSSNSRTVARRCDGS